MIRTVFFGKTTKDFNTYALANPKEVLTLGEDNLIKAGESYKFTLGLTKGSHITGPGIKVSIGPEEKLQTFIHSSFTNK